MEVNMSNNKRLFILFAALIIIVAIVIILKRPGKSLAEDNPDYVAIENTLQSYFEIDAKARYTLDDSRLSDVLANDPRGSYSGAEGENGYLVKAVRWYTGNPDIQEDNIGMLNFWHAYYAYNREVKQIYDNAQAMGKLPMPTSSPTEDPFDIDVLLSTENAHSPIFSGETSPESLPEIQELMKETGFQSASMPLPQPDVIVPEKFIIQSITVDNDVAHVIGDYPYAKVGLTFVKLSGQWYLVGSKIIQWHGG
jgi:hypothetical protein